MGLLDAADRQCPADQALEGDRLQQVASLVQQAAQGVGEREGKHIRLTQSAPDFCQFCNTGEGWPGGKVCSVDGPDRGADHEVEAQPRLDQRLQHADLDDTEAAASGQD
ncbi:hypothetical protein D3C85_1559280 [compost metagenome]